MRRLAVLLMGILLPVAALAANAGTVAPSAKKAPKAASTVAVVKPAPAPSATVPASAPAAAAATVSSTTASPAVATPPPWVKPALAATSTATVAGEAAPTAGGIEVSPEQAGLKVEPMTASPGNAELFTPLFGFTSSEGLNTSNASSFFFATDIDTVLGGRWELNEAQAIFGIYELTYTGPSFQPQVGQEYAARATGAYVLPQSGRAFSDRTLDHSVGLGHQWKVTPEYEVRTHLSFLNEYRRSGANEAFGTGLYDFYTPSVSVDQSLVLSPDLAAGLGLSYSYAIFPNNTNLIADFQAANANSEAAASALDFQQIRIKPSLTFGEHGSVWAAISVLPYLHGKVIDSSGVTGATSQLDLNEEIGTAWRFDLSGKSGVGGALTSDPSLTINARQSNQNYLSFKSLTDTSPQFEKNYYGYWSLDLVAPLHWWLDDTRQFFVQPELAFMGYAARPPRDASGAYLAGTSEYDLTFVLLLGYRKPIYRTGTLTFGYQYLDQVSNNHFERFLPYNYTGNMLFTSVNISY